MAEDTSNIKIINADEAEGIEPDLPEPGWKRDEELAERKGNLEQAAEEAGEVYGFDPSKFDPDRDILQQINELEVDNAQDGMRYFWCYEGLNGRFIVIAQRIGWVVVQGSDPECPSLKDARGYRKIGDTILMRTTEENFTKIEHSREYKRLSREKGVQGALREMGEKYRSKGFIVHDDIRNVNIGRKGKSMMDIMESKARQAGRQQVAMKGVDSMLRKGIVPGMPAPRKGGR